MFTVIGAGRPRFMPLRHGCLLHGLDGILQKNSLPCNLTGGRRSSAKFCQQGIPRAGVNRPSRGGAVGHRINRRFEQLNEISHDPANCISDDEIWRSFRGRASTSCGLAEGSSRMGDGSAIARDRV